MNWRPIGFLLSIACVGCIGPFSENIEREYPNTKAAKAADRGWIPEILPDDATGIREVHNIDSNRTWGCFTTRELGAVRSKLSLLKANRTAGPIHSGPREVFRDFSWWPETMRYSAVEAMEFREPPPYPAAQHRFLIRVGLDGATGTVCFHRSL